MTDEQLRAFRKLYGEAERLKIDATRLRDLADRTMDHADDLEKKAKALFDAVDELARVVPETPAG